MGRPTRIDPDGAIQHVFCRGTRRWALFQDDADRRHFMGTLSYVLDRYGVSSHGYCLMDNHFHLIIQSDEGSVSDVMRDLKSMYARYFNRRHRSSGPLFEGRFRSVLVTSFGQIRRVIRYVHRNPYSIDSAMRLAHYPWSSHGIYTGLRAAPVWLDTSVGLALFADYQADVETPLSSDAVQNRKPESPSNEEVPGTSSLA